jgi:lipoate-protein ligase B
VVEVDRGGDVTFHGPGQLVAYPILDLRARGILPGDYVRRLEQVAIEALQVFGIAGERVAGRPGVWAGGSKIAAIGVRVQGGVTTHGFALNVSTDLAWFDAIVPCGLADATVTSMAALLGAAPPIRDVEDAVIDAFGRTFGLCVEGATAMEFADSSRAQEAGVR